MTRRIGTLAEIPRLHAEAKGDAPALLFEGRETRWRELDRRARRVAQGLGAAGVGRGDVVAYLGRNTGAYFEILFGSARRGGVLAAVNWRLAEEEVACVLDDAEAGVLFVEDAFQAMLDRLRERLPRLHTVVVLGEAGPGEIQFEDWRDAQPARDTQSAAGIDDPVLQLYTSGTTGRPKGARFSLRALRNTLAIRERSGQGFTRIRPGDVNLVHLPLFHIGGVSLAFDHLWHGSLQVVLRQFDAGQVLDALERFDVRRLALAPTMIQMLLEHPRCRPETFARVEYLLYGGSPIGPDLLRRAIDVARCRFVQQYGMTESTGLATFLGPSDHDPSGSRRIESAGRPFEGVELKIVDPEGRRLARGETGEVCIRSRCLMSEYWKQPEATRETIRDGWLHTGDAGFVDEDGYLYIQDRVKDMIVSGAENIYPVEVEKAIASHPAIRMVAVVGVPDERWGEVVKAVVVRNRGCSVSEQEVIDHAARHVARYKRPRSVDFVDELPMNPAGKILRRIVREPYWKGRDRRVS